MVEYDAAAIEAHWQQRWAEAKVFESEVDSNKPKFYCLEMFPYPSGHTHMGHVRNYSIGDAMARYRRLTGYNVLYPMGYDSFGMPAENAARKMGAHPHQVTWGNIESIKSDLIRMGFSYDWRRELATSDATYYRWNQWILLKFHEMGLLEQRRAPVNWCNDCDTVLANEQVRNNRCWRCGQEVVQKEMKQWFLKMTQYADQLLDDLEDIGFPENVKMMQHNWIGRSHGATIRFSVVDSDAVVETFTTRPDTIFGVTFLTLSPEHPLCSELVAGTEYEPGWRELVDECAKMSEFERINMLREKKGVFLGQYATNPLTGKVVPIHAGNFVVSSYGTGAVMAVPGHDQRDYEFAVEYDIAIKRVLLEEESGDVDAPITRAFEGYGVMVNSALEGFDGLVGDAAKKAVIAALEERGAGSGAIQYRLRDWLLSRQRFWGTPIPFIHCADCGIVPVPVEDLPVELPLDITFSEENGGNPLSEHPSFYEVDCPKCGGAARRETDTMDTFYDSSWYFLRFCDAMNEETPFSKPVVDYWMAGGVDLYIGGIEHAVMHLLYARFFTKALRDAGLINISEPFSQLVCQGMVNAPAPYCTDCGVEYHVDLAAAACPDCSKVLGYRSAKMSKSLGNTISPVKMIERLGADTVRLFILFGANPEAGMEWSDSELEAKHRHIKSVLAAFNNLGSLGKEETVMDDWLAARCRVNISDWHEKMSNVGLREGVMVSHYQMLDDWNWSLRRGGVSVQGGRDYLEAWTPMLEPATPHLAEHLWSQLGQETLLAGSVMPESNLGTNDAVILARESYLRDVIDRARSVRGMAERYTEAPLSELVIFTSPEWKDNLARNAIRMHAKEFDFRQGGQKFLQAQACFHDDDTKADAVGMWRGLVVGSKKRRGRIFTFSKGERLLISTNFDERNWLAMNQQFMIEALEIGGVAVHIAGTVDDVAGKSRAAQPMQPGLAYR